MKISELIHHLEICKRAYGDLPIYVDNGREGELLTKTDILHWPIIDMADVTNTELVTLPERLVIEIS
jgi:hypothetical protein